MIAFLPVDGYLRALDAGGPPWLDANAYFWFYSAAAETIGAFAGLLLAGYAIVLTLMGGVEQTDDTYAEISQKLKAGYYQQVRSLAVLVGISVVTNLVSLATSNVQYPFKWIVLSASLFLCCFLIVLGLRFVVRMIDPNKYVRTARRIVEDEDKRTSLSGEKASAEDFLNEFVKLENAINELLDRSKIEKSHELLRAYRPSFRMMLDLLLWNELVEYAEYLNLRAIGQYRNAVVHGKVSQVDDTYLMRIRRAVGAIKGIGKKPRVAKETRRSSKSMK